MTVTNPFAFGAVNPIVAFAMALVGALFGLSCLVRAGKTASRRYGVRWLLFGASALSVVGVWLTHFIAVLGFDVPDSPIRYNVAETILSLFISVLVTVVALQVVGVRRPSVLRVVSGGVLIGGGVAAMHYYGVAASHVEGFYTYDAHLVEASVLIAVVGSIIALALTVWVDSYAAVGAGAVVFAFMVAATHYTGMAALQVHLAPDGRMPDGVEAVSIIIPVTIGGIFTLLAMLFAALGMMSDDGAGLTVDRTILDAAASPTRSTWHIPAQPPREPRSPVEDDHPTTVITMTRLRRPH